MIRSSRSIWHEAQTLPRFPLLTGGLDVDVAIIGGGITGLSCALLLGEAGKRVALFEGRQLGSGVTGSTTAHLTEVVDTRYHELESKFGRREAQLVRAGSREAIEMIASVSSVAKSDCGFRRLSGFLYTEKDDQVAELEEEQAAAERAGLAVQRSDVPLPFRVRAGLEFANQAQVQPLAYLAALIARLPRSYVQVFEDTQVLELETESGLRLKTERDHTVTCQAVILASHHQFVSTALELKLAQYRSYAVAGRAASAPDGLFWDLDDPYHYIRRLSIDGATHVILGGEDHRTGEGPDGGADAPYRRLEAYAARMGVSPQLHWSAQVVESADGLPFIGRPDPDQNVYVATGFAGNGMTFGTLSAIMLKDALLGRDNRYAELLRADRFKPLASLSSLISENADTAVHLLADHLRGVSHEPLENLPAGAGCIARVGDEKLAVFRDHDGALHAVSSVCTHKGCQVAWNALELTWDCPCHGSRFDVQGRVLDGPATKALQPRKL